MCGSYVTVLSASAHIENRYLRWERNCECTYDFCTRYCTFDLSKHVPVNICYSFFNRQEATFQPHLKQEHEKLDRKLKWLILKNNKHMLEKIKPVSYCCSYADRDKASCEPEFSIQPTNNTSSRLRRIEVSVDPKEIIDRVNSSSLLNIRDK